MLNEFDLHCHTTESDGTFTPEQVVKKASSKGIKHLAITDHDNINGVKAAIQAGKKYDVEVIPGVEISIQFEPGTMHICGYFIDPDNEKLRHKLNIVQEARRKRNPQIIQKLNELGIEIDLDEVREEAGSSQVGRPNIAKVLLKKGYVENVQEAFDKYLAKGAACYVNKKRLELQPAIDTIKNSGGVPILAHPVQLGLGNEEEYIEIFSKLKEKGIIGVEAYSTHHNEEENKKFYRLASSIDMLITGGSDFHGSNKPNVHLGEFGEEVKADLEQFLEYSNSRHTEEIYN